MAYLSSCQNVDLIGTRTIVLVQVYVLEMELLPFRLNKTMAVLLNMELVLEPPSIYCVFK